MIYLASPYSAPTSAERYARFAAARDYTNLCMAKGEIIFSPIAYGHQFATVYMQPTDHEWWQNFDQAVILACNELRVLKLTGWDKSKGVQSEMDFAESIGIPITFAR